MAYGPCALPLQHAKETEANMREVTEATMIAAYRAGTAYWQRNKAYDATQESLLTLARSCGWNDDNALAWLAGFYYGAKRRERESI